ncbi:hypothetical protein [Flavobacterium alkalisoli]|uniref:hypothetical protein n=1 Tax=Flavobacterium alkalisoli TaxID=2602769 RepID=UPI003A92945C
MKKRYLFIFLGTIFICLFFFNCKSLLKKSYGITNPKIEKKENIKKYLLKNKIDTTNVLIFKDLQSYAIMTKSRGVKIPNAMFFNSKGNYVDYKKSPEDCTAKIHDFILDIKNLNNTDSETWQINDLSNFILHLDNRNETLFEEGKYDAYVIINWAIFVGKLNHEKAFDWINVIEQINSNDFKIKYYLLNCDFQESWNMTEDQKTSLGL